MSDEMCRMKSFAGNVSDEKFRRKCVGRNVSYKVCRTKSALYVWPLCANLNFLISAIYSDILSVHIAVH